MEEALCTAAVRSTLVYGGIAILSLAFNLAFVLKSLFASQELDE